MKINKNSWHFKLNKFWLESDYRDYDPLYNMGETLCSYFWKTLIRISAIITVSCYIYFLSGLLSFIAIVDPLYTLIAQLQSGYGILWDESYESITVIMSVIVSLLLLGTILLLLDKNKNYLVLQYISAKKDKYCPILTIEE